MKIQFRLSHVLWVIGFVTAMFLGDTLDIVHGTRSLAWALYGSQEVHLVDGTKMTLSEPWIVHGVSASITVDESVPRSKRCKLSKIVFNQHAAISPEGIKNLQEGNASTVKLIRFGRIGSKTLRGDSFIDESLEQPHEYVLSPITEARVLEEINKAGFRPANIDEAIALCEAKNFEGQILVLGSKYSTNSFPYIISSWEQDGHGPRSTATYSWHKYLTSSELTLKSHHYEPRYIWFAVVPK